MQVLNNYQVKPTAFTGKIITKGPWTQKLRDAFINSENVQKLAGGDSDVVGHIKKYVVSDKEGFNNPDHSPGDKLYRISISLVDNNWYSRLADAINFLPRKKLTLDYHRENSLIKRIDKAVFDRYFSTYYG